MYNEFNGNVPLVVDHLKSEALCCTAVIMKAIREAMTAGANGQP